MSKDKGEKKPDDKAKAEVSPEEEAAKSKKKKLLIFGIGGVGLLLGIGAGLFVFLSGGSEKKNANSGEHSTETSHGEAAAGDPGSEHAEPSSEGHGSKKEEHGAAKGDHGGEKKGEGEKKAEGGHGEKKDEHKKGEGDKGGHGAAKEEHGAEKAGGHGEGEKKAEGGHGGGGDKKGDKKTADSKLEGVDFGCTAPLTPFHLNLGNPLENRYIRLEVSLEYGCAEEQKAEIEKRLPQLRDAIISVTSRKTREFLLGPDGKEQLRKEIHNRVNHYMTKKIDDVYITDILIE
jgi:flagellar protein FliL